uniref:Uncharacterized protein n=1 Tax=Onchocerca volvulus TaxID=6282 RepID=A0A8R1Y164_ONCVO
MSLHKYFGTEEEDDEDWWICVPIYTLALVCLLQTPANITWRAASVVVILTGSTLVAFLIWTMHHSADVITMSPLISSDILLLAAAVAMTYTVRLCN